MEETDPLLLMKRRMKPTAQSDSQANVELVLSNPCPGLTRLKSDMDKRPLTEETYFKNPHWNHLS